MGRGAAAVATLLLCTSGAAFGQAPDSFLPSFATLDRADGRAVMGAEVGLSVLAAGFAERTELHGRATNAAGVGGYFSLPYSSWDQDGLHQRGLGNVEVGAVIAPRHFLAVRFGLVFPTASQQGALASSQGAFARLADLPQSTRDVTWLRLAFSPMLRRGEFSLRADLGLDVPFGQDRDLLVRGSLGVGWDVGPATITGELVNVGTAEGNQSLSARFMHTAAVSARLGIGRWQPSLAAVMPLDAGVRDDVRVVFVAGLQFVN